MQLAKLQARSLNKNAETKKENMARKELRMKPLTDIQGGVAKSLMQGVSDLYTQHVDRIEKLVNESDDQCATIRFSVAIDAKGSAPIIDVGIRFTDTITDHRKYSLEDPTQPSLFNDENTGDSENGEQPDVDAEEGEKKRKRRRGKEAASGETVDESDGGENQE